MLAHTSLAPAHRRPPTSSGSPLTPCAPSKPSQTPQTPQVTLYIIGAYCFIKNGGHGRWAGFTDHHLLHYLVTAACCLHVNYITASLAHRSPWPALSF